MTKIFTLSIFLILISIIILIFIRINIYSHPILFIILIIIYRIIFRFTISFWKINFIYSIILFLIIIRGLLIIFLYFSRLISNEQIFLNFNIIYIFILSINFIYLFSLIFYNKQFIINSIYLYKENEPIINLNNKIFSNIINLYVYPFNNITIICILFLLIRLFIIIKISSIKSKPLRKISN